MVRGLGVDLVDIERIRKSLERHQDHFTSRLFTEKEKAYCMQFKDPAIHFAGRFAAKEAIAKALGVGFGKELRFLDLEILNDEKGKPFVIFSLKARDRFDTPSILIAISHEKNFAMASAIWY